MDCFLEETNSHYRRSLKRRLRLLDLWPSFKSPLLSSLGEEGMKEGKTRLSQGVFLGENNGLPDVYSTTASNLRIRSLHIYPASICTVYLRMYVSTERENVHIPT